MARRVLTGVVYSGEAAVVGLVATGQQSHCVLESSRLSLRLDDVRVQLVSLALQLLLLLRRLLTTRVDSRLRPRPARAALRCAARRSVTQTHGNRMI